MLAQKIETSPRNELIAFWDLGYQVMMLTHRKAAAAGLQPKTAIP